MMRCAYCQKAHATKDCKAPLRERPMEEVLTRQEHDAVVRFGIHPREMPTPKQKIIYERATAKLRKERRRHKQAMRRFLARAEKFLKSEDRSFCLLKL